MTLPRHINEDKLRDSLAQAWSNLSEYARVHEAVHLAIADRYALVMEDAILALPPAEDCPLMRLQVQNTFSEQYEKHHAEQLAFDASEKRRIRALIAQNN